jgi:RHS repeat-associated protein
MTTGTGGATIFYTVASTSSPPPVTHNGATPTGSTKAYSTPIPLYANTDNYYRALAYKATYTDSRDVVVYEENTDPGRHPHGKKRTKRAAQAPSSTRSLTFNLDNCGNRTSVVDTATGTAVYVPNNLNQYTSVGGSGVTNGPSHEITTYGGTSYYYIGDTYLAQAVSGNNTLQLYYDPLGRCIMRSINDVSTFYIFDGEHWIVEFDTSNVIVSNVLYGRGIDEVIARANHYAPNGSEFQWFYPDRNGNISVVADVTGHVLESYRYDPFGKPTMYAPDGTVRGGSAISNRFLFTGREWRSAFGFYEYRARAYNPTLGRFMSEDPKGFQAGDYNLYRYVGNDPLDRSDPTGLDGEVVIFRPEGRTSVDNDGVIFENGRAVASFRANENGFIPLSSGPTRGPRRGEYVLLPKINAKPGDSFPNGQPSVTARPYADSTKPNYAPGRAGPDYRAEGTVRVHKKSSDGSPDSTGCVTACAPAVDRVTKLMNDNIDSGGTRIILIDGKQTVDGHEVRRAEPIVPLRYGE